MEKVAKLCADFKIGTERIFVTKDNKREYVDVDDSIRQGEYKYTYSDSGTTALKSEQADLVVSTVEHFAQAIPLNLQEIFIWYFEQKGVDNPERFLMEINGINDRVNEQSAPSYLVNEKLNSQQTVTPEEQLQPENPISQNVSQNVNETKIDLNTLTLLLNLLQQVNKTKGENATPGDFISILESVLENTNDKGEINEV